MRMRSYSTAFTFAMLLHLVAIALLLFKIATPNYSNGLKRQVIHAYAINYIPHRATTSKKNTPKIIKPKHVIKPVIKPKPKPTTKPKPIVKPKKTIKIASKKAVKPRHTKPKAHPRKKAPKLTRQTEIANLDAAIAKEMAAQKSAAKTATKAKPKFSSVQQGVIDKYKADIIATISANWLVPQNTENHNIQAVLMLNIAPGGVVLNAKIIKSSGNDVLDRSAINAVYKSSPLPVPNDPTLFEEFRHIKLTVKPDF